MIRVDERYCKGCALCIHLCPRQVLAVSQKVNSRGFYTPCVIDADNCTNCRQCEFYCPDFAIFIVEDDEREDG